MSKYFLSYLLLCSALTLKAQDNVLRLIAHKDAQGHFTKEFFEHLQTVFQSEAFIETGTGYGNGALTAAQVFPIVHTIELHNDLYHHSRARLAPVAHIATHFGASEQILPHLVSALAHKRMLVNLDAHYCGGGSAKGETVTPVLKEIEVIAYTSPQAVIIADDLRFFQKHPRIAEFIRLNPSEDNIAGYPDIHELIARLHAISPHYQPVAYGDALILYRTDYYPTVRISPVLQALTASRLVPISEHNNATLSNVFAAESILLKPENSAELRQLSYLLNYALAPSLFSTYYCLWNGIASLAQKEYGTAQALFRNARHNGLSLERLAPYLEMVTHVTQ